MLLCGYRIGWVGVEIAYEQLTYCNSGCRYAAVVCTEPEQSFLGDASELNIVHGRRHTLAFVAVMHLSHIHSSRKGIGLQPQVEYLHTWQLVPVVATPTATAEACEVN